MLTATFVVALTTFFATIGPADLALVFAALTHKNTAFERRAFALRGTAVAAAILLFFAVFGTALLGVFGITLPALRTAGGALLFLISLDMVFARHSGGTGTTSEEEAEARTRADISVFPLAMPLIAGPGAISATIVLISGAQGDNLKLAAVFAALLIILALTYLALLIAIPIQRLLGLTGLAVVSRIVGVLLAALSVQFIFDGIKGSGLLGGG
ncbi:MAG: MarC family protein [Devosia sp.]|jgi:multiple antibiotic resistance protein|nr:MarC family protein [Devosiaceae bacterium]